MYEGTKLQRGLVGSDQSGSIGVEQPISIPEITASISNLEKEYDYLASTCDGILARMDGVLRPDHPRPETNQKELNVPTKAPISEHVDRIAIRVRIYRQHLENIAERLAL